MTARAGLAPLVIGMVAVLGAAAGARTADRAIATTIEQALIERACSTPLSVAVDSDKHEECLEAKLNGLRADFGRDLSRLSAAERRKIDSACAPIRGIEGREGYLDCLASQLVLVQRRWSRGREGAASPAAVAETSAAAISTAAPVTDRVASSSRTGLFAALAALVAGALAVPLVIKVRRSRRACQVCGIRVGSSGDMCPACRHEAAEVLRRAAAERVDRQRAHDDQEQRRHDRAEEERRRLACEAEETVRQQELARASEEQAQRLEEEARHVAAAAADTQSAAIADGGEVAFDPYAILGVPRGAGFDAIHAAYEQAKSKYDLEQVADLGFEITQHYIAKAQAAARAFEMLAAHQRQTSAGASEDAHADHVDPVPAL